MAKGNIDPGFQAAPFLGESSHDPIEFTRRHNLAKFQTEKAKAKEVADTTAKGLDELALDLKDLYNEKGIDEVLKDSAQTKEAFIKLQKSGINVFNPTSPLEIKAYQTILKKQEETIKKVDAIKANKAIIELQGKAAFEDSKLPEDKQIYDQAAYRANLDAAKKAEGGVIETKGIFDNLLVKKPQIGDMYEYSRKNKDRFPVLDTTQEDYIDPETNETRSRMVSQWTPEKIAEARAVAKQMYQEAPEDIKRSVALNQERIRKTDPKSLLAMATPEEFYIDSTLPQEAQKFSDKSKSSGGLSFNFLGTTAKIVPGELRENNNFIGSRNYNKRYDFAFPTKKLFNVPTSGGFQHNDDAREARPAVGDVPAKPATTGWEPITGGDYAEAELLFYDPKNDELVFRTGQAAENPWIKNNTTFAVPRKNVPDAEKLPIMVNGKKTELKSILPKEDPNAKKILPLPENFWSTSKTPYIPTNRKQ
jgi:hypothetical protein